MGAHTAIAIGLALYAAFMLAASVFWTTRVKRTADYLVAGRGLPFWVLTGTITATCVGTGVVVGAPGLAYRHGWAGSAYPLGLGLGTVLTGAIFAGTRRYQFMTLGEEIACYYGGNRIVLEVSNFTLFLSQLCWLTVQIMGSGSVLGAVTGLRPELCLVLAGLIMAGISIPGGLKTVVYTDFLNAGILLCGFGFLTYSSLHQSGGMAGLRQATPGAYSSFLGVASYGKGAVTGLVLALGLSVIADPGRRLAMYSARTEQGARWSMVAAGVIVMAFSMIIGIVGMYAFRLNSHLPSPDQALPWLAMNALPAWLAALVVVSMTSAIVSCANNNAMAAGSFFVRHIFPFVVRRYAQNPIGVARRSLAVAYVACTALALHAGTIVGFVTRFLPVTMSGLAVILLAGNFWKRTTWQGAMAALGVTPAISLAALYLPAAARFMANPTVVAALIGSAALVIVSLLTPRTQRSFAEVAAGQAIERQAFERESADAHSSNYH